MKKELFLKTTVLSLIFVTKTTPQVFFLLALPIILRDRGFSLEIIGLLQLSSIPYLIKFLWAPMMERNGEKANHFKRWTRHTGILYAVIILAIGGLNLKNIYLTGLLIMAVAIVAATQDIALGALYVKLLDYNERGFAGSVKIFAYNIANLLGCGLLLIIYNHTSWMFISVVMAVMILVSMAVMILVSMAILPLLTEKQGKPTSVQDRVRFLDWLTFFQKTGMKRWLVIMIVHSLGISAIQFIMRPFLVDLQFDMDLIAFLTGVFGLIVGAITSLVAGIFPSILQNRRKAILVFSVLNIIASAYFILVAMGANSMCHIYVAIALINISVSLSTVLCGVLVMDFSRENKAGIDYSIQMTAVHIGVMIMMAISGFIVAAIGYCSFFTLQTLIGIAVFVAIFYLFRGNWIPKGN